LGFIRLILFVCMSAGTQEISGQQKLGESAEDALKAATFRRLHPRLYLERFLAEDVRPDGRAEDEFRGLAVNVGAFSKDQVGACLTTFTRVSYERGWIGTRQTGRHDHRLRRQSRNCGTGDR
jgi:hypothetical protein